MNLSTHGIVALVRNDDGKFLLLEDSRELMRGSWAPPHGRCEVTDESETSEFGWFSIDEALKIKLYPGTRTFFEKIKAGELPLE